MGFRIGLFRLGAVLFVSAVLAFADVAPFDLSGPRVEVRVTRGTKTLPISQVPSLEPGDRLWIRPDMPAGQSARYLLVATFLRGATNPPPDNWFTKADTLSKQMREEGIAITVPQDAQQALFFLAPQTGGDFSSLRSAVRGKPGAFVRASQDLNQASRDRSRLDRYLSIIRQIAGSEPSALHERSVLLARSLNMKVDEQCFDKPSSQQAPCLMQNTDQLVLEDGQGPSLVSTLTSGPGSDLIGQVSATRAAGGGAYSAYVGAIVDVVRLMEKFHTPSYQYIPALVTPKRDQLNLRLNNPPSFHKPKSVLVVSLPPVEPAQPPVIRPVDPNSVSCLQKPSLVLPVQGAPLIFSTDLAHDMVLHVQDKNGQATDIPVTADPAQGGLVVSSKSIDAPNLDVQVSGKLRGRWGFHTFEGPAFELRNARPAKWTVPTAEATGLVVGRDNSLHLQSAAAACVEDVTVQDQQGNPIKANWKASGPDEVALQVSLQGTTPGPLTVLVKPYGTATPDEVPLRAYSEPARLDRLIVSAGAQDAVLHGTQLEQVASVELNGVRLAPTKLSRADRDELWLAASEGAKLDLRPEEKLTANIVLKDGRILPLETSVAPQRPRVTVISKSVQPGTAANASAIRLSDSNDVPQDGRLSFLLKAEVPKTFAKSTKIEVATADNAFRTLLSVGDGTLVLQDPQTALAVIEPLKSFGPSAFGQIRFRPVDKDLKGDWQPLGNLVRIPALKEIRCPENPEKSCSLIGNNLYLIDSVAADPKFENPISVPVGFLNSTLNVPRPNGTLLYVKLRDDPTSVNTIVLPVFPQ